MQIRIVMLFIVIILYNCRSTTTEVAIVELTHEAYTMDFELESNKAMGAAFVVYGELGNVGIKEEIGTHELKCMCQSLLIPLVKK